MQGILPAAMSRASYLADMPAGLFRPIVSLLVQAQEVVSLQSGALQGSAPNSLDHSLHASRTMKPLLLGKAPASQLPGSKPAHLQLPYAMRVKALANQMAQSAADKV